MKFSCLILSIVLLTVVKVNAQDLLNDLTAQPDATSVILRWTPYSGFPIAEHSVKRDGIEVGKTIGKYGYFTDYGLSPNTTYTYAVEGLAAYGANIWHSNTIQITTTSSSTIKTNYSLLAIVFNPGGVLQSDMSHIRTFLDYRLDFLRYASHNSVNLDLYGNDILSINAYPPLQPNSTEADYIQLSSTSYPELDNNTIVDLIERYDVDVVWVVGTPQGYDFGENTLMGNHNLGNNTWITRNVKCSRSFFIHGNLPDARALDAAAHHVEGTMTSAAEKSPGNWPRDKEYLVYTTNRSDYSVYPMKLHLFERFRLTDEWTGTGAYASKGNANCGSSHFVPGSIRNSATHPDYTYYDVEAWKRYVDCYADDWLSYPVFSNKSRKINGFDFGAFDNYHLNSTTKTFTTGTASFHQWWFNHIPHNEGVTDGKLNNWWPYIYDCNRFDGSAINYSVFGFPAIPATYETVNDEYGTEENGSSLHWMYWHSGTDFGQRADLSAVSKEADSEHVKSGAFSTRVNVHIESFSTNGRNDLIYPKFKNAHWQFTDIDSIMFSIKFEAQDLLQGTNPILRLCKNGNNRIEFVPRSGGTYANLFDNLALRDSDGWYTFRIPVAGNDTWERNIIGYVDPDLDDSGQEEARQQIIQNVLSDVNYFEISILSGGSRGETLVYYIDNITVHTKKEMATVTLGDLVAIYDGDSKEATATTLPPGLLVEMTYDGSLTPPTQAGTYEVIGTINDQSYQGTATANLVISKATATIQLENLISTYDGTPVEVTATTNPAGLSVALTYDDSSTPPTQAGTYVVVGTINDVNYQGIATGSMVISKALGAIQLGNLTTTYDGTPRIATVVTNPVGLSVAFTYDGSSTPPTQAGTYVVVGTINDVNYRGTATASLVISKALATILLENLATTYSGTPKVATAVTNPAGLSVAFTYDGSSAPPTQAGTYLVMGTINDVNYQGSATGSMVISKALGAIQLGNLTTTYDGTPRMATAVTNPVGLSVAFTYDGSSAPPTQAGTYLVVGTINDANYQGTATGSLVISKAPATIQLEHLTTTYSGTPKVATAVTNPAGLSVAFTYDGSSTPPTQAGTYIVVGTINDVNYQGTATGSLVISKALATIMLENLTTTYSGTPKVAAAVTNPAGLSVALTYDGSSAPPTQAGTYVVVGTISDANHQGTTTGSLVISKATLVALAEDASRNIGEPNPEFTVVYDGFLNSETEEVIDIKPGATCIADALSGAGVYEIKVDGGMDNNYDFVYVHGTLTVNVITSVIETNVPRYRVFPNPFSNSLTIETPHNESVYVRMFDMSGRLIFEGIMNGSIIDVQSLLPGNYSLVVDKTIYKLIKN